MAAPGQTFPGSLSTCYLRKHQAKVTVAGGDGRCFIPAKSRGSNHFRYYDTWAGILLEDSISKCRGPACALEHCFPAGSEFGPGVYGQYHQPVSAKAQTRSPRAERRQKPEIRNARTWLRPSVFGLLSGFGPRNSDLGGWRRVVLSRHALGPDFDLIRCAIPAWLAVA